ncbi:MAG TPA: phospho-sugar mutase [archaeon]|nr:phospho-sugar mutase [archaeon]
MLDPKIEKKARIWLGPEFDRKVREEIQGLLDSGSWEELTDRFYKDLEFGTGGMRGVLGAGTNRMNEYVVRMTTQGLANYLLRQGGDRFAGVIAYDSRHKSKEFALETALVLAANGITAYIFESLRPTPELSFAVRYLRATVGVVITASHNPPEYNGYKVYWSDGGQIIPPHDKGIVEEVGKVRSIQDVRWISRKEAERSGLLHWLGAEVDERFLEAVARQIVQPDLVRQAAETLSIVYTPLHGTGVTMVPKALERMGLKRVDVLASQREPDPDFPTVKTPNPEEKAALELAISRAGETGASLVIATDPDCDRVGLAYREAGGEFKLLNGNQIGSILCHYMLEQLSRKGTLPACPVIIKTIVTTELQRAIAESFGAEVIDVLTGFKYIGEQIHLFEEEGKGRHFVFGGEESYGYLAGTHARDKDAVVSSQLIAEVAAACALQGKTLGDYLDDIYRRYGVYLETLRSLTLKGKKGSEEIGALMERFRSDTPGSISGSKVVGRWDLEQGERVDFETGRTTWTSLPSSNVLVFYLDDKSKVTMRPSGTEPKIKFYFGVMTKSRGPLEEVKKEALQRLGRLEADFMKLVDQALGKA